MTVKSRVLRLLAGGPKPDGRVPFSNLAELPKASSDLLAIMYPFTRSFRLLGISLPTPTRDHSAANAKQSQRDLDFYLRPADRETVCIAPSASRLETLLASPGPPAQRQHHGGPHIPAPGR